MTKKHDEAADLALVTAFFAKHCLAAVPFTKDERRAGRTPDFKIMRGVEIVAYCEVKSLSDDDTLDEMLARTPAFKIVGFAKDDPRFNRISTQVHKAVSQFDAVNADRRVPNILVFINHDEHGVFNDLEEALSGYLRLDDGRLAATMLNVSEGRIRQEKERIDLFVWQDADRGPPHGYLFGQSDAAHLDAVCSLLGMDKSKIRA